MIFTFGQRFRNALTKNARIAQALLSRIDVAFAQVADKQPFAAEDIQGRKAKIVVITVKWRLLKPVYSIVGRVKIQNQFARGRLEAVESTSCISQASLRPARCERRPLKWA